MFKEKAQVPPNFKEKAAFKCLQTSKRTSKISRRKPTMFKEKPAEWLLTSKRTSKRRPPTTYKLQREGWQVPPNFKEKAAKCLQTSKGHRVPTQFKEKVAECLQS